MNTKVMFSSASDEWETPQDLFNELNAKYHLTLDVAASRTNAKCNQYFSAQQDGLKQKWIGRCWMNPPYGRQIGKWIQKAYEESRNNAEIVVCLLPSRTDTKWFHDYILPYAEIHFIRGRLKFGGCNNSAPFPSLIAIFRR
jgi:phage N-6-adenine-methyltransferase